MTEIAKYIVETIINLVIFVTMLFFMSIFHPIGWLFWVIVFILIGKV